MGNIMTTIILKISEQSLDFGSNIPDEFRKNYEELLQLACNKLEVTAMSCYQDGNLRILVPNGKVRVWRDYEEKKTEPDTDCILLWGSDEISPPTAEKFAAALLPYMKNSLQFTTNQIEVLENHITEASYCPMIARHCCMM